MVKDTMIGAKVSIGEYKYEYDKNTFENREWTMIIIVTMVDSGVNGNG